MARPPGNDQTSFNYLKDIPSFLLFLLLEKTKPPLGSKYQYNKGRRERERERKGEGERERQTKSHPPFVGLLSFLPFSWQRRGKTSIFLQQGMFFKERKDEKKKRKEDFFFSCLMLLVIKCS